MILATLSFTLGIWLLQQQAVLPNLLWSCVLIVLLLSYQIFKPDLWHGLPRSISLVLFAICSGFFYAAWMAQQRLADTLPEIWQGRDIAIIGVVADMPQQHERGLSFTFDVERVLTQNAQVPRHILLSTYNTESNERLELHAGERWQLVVRLKQPHGSSNPYTFDFEAWALERNLRAMGYIYAKGDNRRMDEHVMTAGYAIERIREAVRSHFQTTLGASRYAGVLSALAIGDQGSIPASQWQIFTRTGVNHLMSISGLHITMLAGLGFTLCYWLWCRSAYLSLCLPARKAATLVGLLLAIAYALLSGYGIPAQRTVYMLATIAAAMWLSRNISPSQLLAAALLVVLLIDPWAVTSAGFWLSFGAVGLIFYVTSNRLGVSHWLREYALLQWAMSIGLIPLLLAMFQQISLISPLANIFAIPLVSFIVVPLTLMGALLPFDWILKLAHACMSLVMLALDWLNQLPLAVWVQHAPPAWSVIAGMLGVLWILLPRGFPARWLGIIFLLPLFLLRPEPPPSGALHLTIFDVGQGLAVAAQTRNHTLLYDTGPGINNESNSGNRILVPALRGMGIAHLDTLMLTHNDSDHTGGALSVMQDIPIDLVSSSLPPDSPIVQHAARSVRCSDGQQWDWDDVHFEVLHPSPESYDDDNIKNNDRGCVLRISSGTHSVLLAADIEKKSEIRLLQHHPDKLQATLLVVPHHGSKTSSSPQFVDAVKPGYAVFTAGYRNHFGHPKAEVIARYQEAGSELLRSDRDGAILVEMNKDKLDIRKYRLLKAHYWQ